MKAHVIGVTRVEGVSNKSGQLKPYDMARILSLQPCEVAGKIDDKTGTRYSKTGFGYELMEIDLESAEVMQKFAQVRFPAMLDLEMDQVPRFGKLQTVCVGFKPLPAAQ